MRVQLTDDQKASIQEGRFAHEEDALKEALSLWEVRERRRAEILAAINQAEAFSHAVKVAGLRLLKKQRSLPAT